MFGMAMYQHSWPSIPAENKGNIGGLEIFFFSNMQESCIFILRRKRVENPYNIPKEARTHAHAHTGLEIVTRQKNVELDLFMVVAMYWKVPEPKRTPNIQTLINLNFLSKVNVENC